MIERENKYLAILVSILDREGKIKCIKRRDTKNHKSNVRSQGEIKNWKIQKIN